MVKSDLDFQHGVLATERHQGEINKFNQIHKDFRAAINCEFSNPELTEKFEEKLYEYENFFEENLLQIGYLSGHELPMMIDFHVFPMVERIIMLENGPLDSHF